MHIFIVQQNTSSIQFTKYACNICRQPQLGGLPLRQAHGTSHGMFSTQLQLSTGKMQNQFLACEFEHSLIRSSRAAGKTIHDTLSCRCELYSPAQQVMVARLSGAPRAAVIRFVSQYQSSGGCRRSLWRAPRSAEPTAAQCWWLRRRGVRC